MWICKVHLKQRQVHQIVLQHTKLKPILKQIGYYSFGTSIELVEYLQL